MTRLSVNLNKIALLRNSRGRDYPNVVAFARRFVALGVHGITVHPRPDERHTKRGDVSDLAAALRDASQVEFNVEGYPNEEFLRLVETAKPDQCTLVPDAETQLTSDHGWDIGANEALLQKTIARLGKAGIRASIFVDADRAQIKQAAAVGAERIELYTQAYAEAHQAGAAEKALEKYRRAAACAVELGLGVNAGHDLDLNNLAAFLSIGDILEVSIGHALTVECIEYGIEATTKRYLEICRAAGVG